VRGAVLALKVGDGQVGIAENVHPGWAAAQPVPVFVRRPQSVVKLVDETLHGVGALAVHLNRLAAGGCRADLPSSLDDVRPECWP
jgi:hypothetical protein